MHTYRIIDVRGVHGVADLGCRLLRDGKVVGCGSEREMLRLCNEIQIQDGLWQWKLDTTIETTDIQPAEELEIEQ